MTGAWLTLNATVGALPGVINNMLGLAKLMPYEYSPIVLLALGGFLLSVGALAGPETKDADFRSVR